MSQAIFRETAGMAVQRRTTIAVGLMAKYRGALLAVVGLVLLFAGLAIHDVALALVVVGGLLVAYYALAEIVAAIAALRRVS